MVRNIGSSFPLLLILLLSCQGKEDVEALFRALPVDRTGIDFTNQLDYTEQLNPYTFKNFYNGGGVAIGDLNNDGLADIFFCGNMVSNRLFLNKGDLSFEDITESSGLATDKVWSSGVSMVDINADGWLDIYVCKSGPPGGERRYNELFINNGDLTFSERSGDYGLDIVGLSVHTAFFDFDKDGDLDCYVLNNSIKSIGGYDLIKDQRTIPDTLGGNKLLRNDDGLFTDITQEAGIFSSDIGFGLGVTIGDINGDHWSDIYVSNDFFERDYLYINNQNGTFTEALVDYIKELSMGSMGADLADINNDGNPEIFVTEMLPARHDRLMSKAIFDSWDKYQYAVEQGYHQQFGRNVLQLNNGDGTFSEIGRYANVEASDWSWGALILDMDNDGFNDIFVSNGIYKDLLDLDYINFLSDPATVRKIIQSNKEAVRSMIDMMPSEPLANCAFRNLGNNQFEDMADQWGLGGPTFSNGSAYGDLDNDGDLDLVVNNVNMPASLYENRSRQLLPERNFIGIRLKGTTSNTMAIGSKIRIYAKGREFHRELNPMRGFESTVDHKVLVGLGEISSIDSLVVMWPVNNKTTLYNLPANQVLELTEAEAKPLSSVARTEAPPLFSVYENDSMQFVHKENPYVDFDKDRLLFHMNSTEGPCMCKGDVNQDGLEDFYIGGARSQAGSLFLQRPFEDFDQQTEPFRRQDESEDLDCAFFDANNDGNLDLYVASGGSEFSSISAWLNDRLYFGDGAGGFILSDQRLPDKGFESTSVVLPFDVDDDGDQDLFVGGRSVPFYYGIPANSYLLTNDGAGNFTNVTSLIAPGLSSIGMVTDATLADLNGDSQEELVIVGQWMPVKIFQIVNGGLMEVTKEWGLTETNGWYNSVKAADFNGDGFDDLVVGNHGLNTRFEASKDHPIELLVADIDNNGTMEQVTSMYFEGKKYPFVQLRDLSMQLPVIKKKYLRFNDYKSATMDQIFPLDELQEKIVLKTYNLATGLFISDGHELSFEPLPMHAQLSPTYGVMVADLNEDGNLDLILGGNFAESKPEAGPYHASFAAVFVGTGTGAFEFLPSQRSGLRVDGNIREIMGIDISDKQVILLARNNDKTVTINRR